MLSRYRIVLACLALFVLAPGLVTACQPVEVVHRPQPAEATTDASPTSEPTRDLRPPTATPYPIWSDQAAALVSSAAGDLSHLGRPTQYDIRAQVFPDRSYLTGDMVVQFTNQEDVPLDRLPFRLFPNLPERNGHMDIQAVMLDGQPIEPAYDMEDSVLAVPLEPALEPGNGVEVRIDYVVEIPLSSVSGYQEFVNRDNVITLAGFYPLIPAYDAQGWSLALPPAHGDAVYADVALFRVTLTAPRSLVVAATGVEVDSHVDLLMGTKTITFVSGPARDFNLALSPEYQVVSQEVGETRLQSYHRSGHRVGGQRALRIATESFRFYSEAFGLYPYVELDIVETPTSAGGIEYPGLVVINQSYYRGPSAGYMDWVVAHEVAHQWWYGVVGNDQIHEPWVDEALTNYSAWLYYEDMEDPEVAQDLFDRVFLVPAEQADRSGKDQPIGLPVGAYSADNYGAIVYGKGPLFFHALRTQVGDETFFAILRAYFAHYEYSIATGEDFLAVAEEVSGQDLWPLYEEWVVNGGQVE